MNQYETSKKAQSYQIFCNSEKTLLNSLKKKVLGNFADKTIFDLACGNGIDAIFYCENGAAHVVGIDLSSAMLKEANNTKRASKYENKMEFFVGDCSDLASIVELGGRKSDIVMSSFLLCYAQSTDHLFTMAKSMYAVLKDGGRCAAIIPNNMNLQPKDYAKHFKYGLKKELLFFDHSAQKGEIRVSFFNGHVNNGEFLFEVIDTFFPDNIYSEVFVKAGFKNFTWVFSNAADFDKEDNLSDDDLAYPANVGFFAEK